LAISINQQGQIFLQKDEIKLDDLLPKLKAIIDARGGTSNDLIYIRGDKTVAYGTMMRVMGRISGAGYHRVALVTDIEQGGQ
jgi:biopolymer transport protein TolR